LAVRDGKVYTLDPRRGLLFILSSDLMEVLEVRKFPNPAMSGLAWGRDFLWSTDARAGRIYQHEHDSVFSLRKTFANPHHHPSAVYWDGKYLWTSDVRNQTIYQHTVGKALTLVGQYTLPGLSPVGLHRAGDLLWVFDGISRKVYRYRLGSLLSRHDAIDLDAWLPRHSQPTGFAVEGPHLWIVTENPAEVHVIEWALLPEVSAGDRGVNGS